MYACFMRSSTTIPWSNTVTFTRTCHMMTSPIKFQPYMLGIFVLSGCCVCLLLMNGYVFTAVSPFSRALSATLVNNAPVLPVRSTECRLEALWGTKDHGGWYVCLDSLGASAGIQKAAPSPCVVYSFGLGADWSFDKAAEKHGCSVHGFDPTNNLWQSGMHGSEYSHFNYATQYPSEHRSFHNWGLGALDSATYLPGTFPQDWPGLGDPPFSKTNTQPWIMKSVERTMADLKHSRLSVLKIDVEGAEWTAVAAMLESKKMRKILASGGVDQLLFEFHWNPDTSAMNKRYEVTLKRLEMLGFVAWRVERHVGSDCCLDISYVWKQPNLRFQD